MRIFIITICNKNENYEKLITEKYEKLIRNFYGLEFININPSNFDISIMAKKSEHADLGKFLMDNEKKKYF